MPSIRQAPPVSPFHTSPGDHTGFREVFSPLRSGITGTGDCPNSLRDTFQRPVGFAFLPSRK